MWTCKFLFSQESGPWAASFLKYEKSYLNSFVYCFVYSSKVSLTPVIFSWPEMKMLEQYLCKRKHFISPSVQNLDVHSHFICSEKKKKIYIYIYLARPLSFYTIHIPSFSSQLITFPPTVVIIASLLFVKLSRQNPMVPLLKCSFCLW